MESVPASETGEAAASLQALFAAGAPQFAERPPPTAAQSAASTAGTSSGGSPADLAELRSSGEGAAWRVKFLHKVGIPNAAQRSALEAPSQLGRPPSSGSMLEEHGDASSEVAADDGDPLGVADDPEEVVVVRQPAPRRSSDDIRLGYIKKLEHSRAFIPQLNRPKRSQTVTIYDWDDTLLCTSERTSLH